MSAEIAEISQESVGLENASLFPQKVFLVRMSTVILFNLVDTGIREAIV